jgi:stearoyl-CoA desaturase (delta-9 desaturase)
MNFGSTRYNIGLLTAFFATVSLAGLFYFEFSASKIIIAIVSFYILNIIGVWLVMHRYYSHRSFEFRNNFLKILFTSIAILAGRGSMLGWAYIHRTHHRYSDSALDPHAPEFLGFTFFNFGHYKKLEEEKMQKFLVKDLFSREHLFVHKYYLLIVLSFIAVLGMFSLEMLYFCYIIPCFFVQVSQSIFNYFGHIAGYRNFDTNDNSRNNSWLFPLILGEAWHNNHHYDSKSANTKVKSNEWDPLGILITLVKK